MIYSALLEMECPIVEICAAAGLPANSTFGQVIISLMDQLEAARKQQTETPSLGFRPVPKVTADSILRQLSIESLFACEKCAGRLREMLARWKLAGIVHESDDSPEIDERAKRQIERLLQ